VDHDQAAYIFRYYGRFMTKQEHFAHRHLFGTMKAAKGRSDALAQSKARSRAHHTRELFSDDPEVLSLASGGFDAFMTRTAERIFKEHRDAISLNYCCRCGVLARTPRAKQCRSCGNDWHATSS